MLNSELEATLLDVGWGDSILLCSRDNAGTQRFGLIDSNDTVNRPNTKLFLTHYIDRLKLSNTPMPFFEFVVATHSHADHISGLQGILKEYGTKELYLSHCNPTQSIAFAKLMNWVRRTQRSVVPKVRKYTYVGQYGRLSNLGVVRFDVLWPPASGVSVYDANNDNNNSLVIAATIGTVCIVFTGDCEADNWGGSGVRVQLPSSNVRMVQLPHHGARNGVYDSNGQTPMIDEVSRRNSQAGNLQISMTASCHYVPHKHPDDTVITLLDQKNIQVFRTDQLYHTTVWTDGTSIRVERKSSYQL